MLSGSDGMYYVYQVDPGLITDDLNEVGSTRTFRVALDLVKAHSGGNVLDISEW